MKSEHRHDLRKVVDFLVINLSDHFLADYKLIDTSTRKREVITVRHMVMYYVFKNTRLSYAETASIFNQDHANCLSAVNKIEWFLKSDSKIIEWDKTESEGCIKRLKMRIEGKAYSVEKKYTAKQVAGMINDVWGDVQGGKMERYLKKTDRL